MIFEELLAKQLSQPSGVLGSITAFSMNRSFSDLNREAIELLNLKPEDRVLEIGFGGGEAIGRLIAKTPNGLVAGIDVSDSMVQRGEAKFRKYVAAGRVELKKAAVSQIPYEAGFFDKALTVMSIFFWPDPVASLREIGRVLKNQGMLVLAVRSKEWMEKFPPARHGFSIYSDDQLWSLFDKAGFANIHTEARETKRESTFVVAVKN